MVTVLKIRRRVRLSVLDRSGRPIGMRSSSPGTLSIAVVLSVLTLIWIAPAGPLAAAARIDHEAECTYKRLTWDDFRGPIVNGQQTAWIAATIVLEPVLVDMVESTGGGAIARARNPIVYAIMNKLQSGAQRGGRDDRSLAHEQIHFDLTEFLARRLSRELRELELEGEARSEALQRSFLLEVERRYGTTLAELQRLQGQYDGETGHGTRTSAQKKWSGRAADLLASEAPYELR
jgi:hypothetical protein